MHCQIIKKANLLKHLSHGDSIFFGFWLLKFRNGFDHLLFQCLAKGNCLS